MGRAIYCDRCNKLFNTAEINIKKGKIVGLWNNDLIFDMCPECRDALEMFIYGDDLKQKNGKEAD